MWAKPSCEQPAKLCIHRKKKLQHDGFCWVNLFLSFSCLLTTSYAQLIPKSSLAFSLKKNQTKKPNQNKKTP